MSQIKIENYTNFSMNRFQVLKIQQELQKFFTNFEFNNEKDCIKIIIDEECAWNTMINQKQEINFYILHKTMFTSNILLMNYDWYHWEMPNSGYRFTKQKVSKFKQDFPEWKNSKYFLFTKAIKKYIVEKWNLIENQDFIFELGFLIFKQIFSNFTIRLIPSINYYHFDNYSLTTSTNYIKGIFYRLKTRDFYTRFPTIEKEKIQQKNKLTNNTYTKTICFIKWLSYEMFEKNYINEKPYLKINQYYIFDYLLYSVPYSLFLDNNIINRCLNVLEDILNRVKFSYDSILLPNELIAFWELEIDNEEIEYILENLINYIQILFAEENLNYEITNEVQTFIDYMENIDLIKLKKH